MELGNIAKAMGTQRLIFPVVTKPGVNEIKGKLLKNHMISTFFFFSFSEYFKKHSGIFIRFNEFSAIFALESPCIAFLLT